MLEAGRIDVVGAAVEVELTPADQERDISARWAEIERELVGLTTPVTTTLTGDAVKERSQGLQRFFGHCYSLKDHVKRAIPEADRGWLGHAISQVSELGLVADLGNLEKHGSPLNTLRSGAQPRFGKASGQTCEGGRNVHLPVEHGTQTLDGLEVALRGVDAWRRLLASLGILSGIVASGADRSP